jgi:serine/threonine protein kinase
MPGKIGNIQILRTLGSGSSCKVKLGLDEDAGRKVAVKILLDDIDDKTKELVITEVEAMSVLDHPNVIKQLQYGTGSYIKNNGKTKEVTYIVLELALGGELFDFVAISGRFTEPMARFFFQQFLDGITYCHAQGIAHRDLKPENLLLDKNFTLKIADFGFAAPIEGRDGQGNLTTKLGTMNYMAPEIHLNQPYQGSQIDVFASAIILFIMVAQHPPFTAAQPSDPFYRCLAGKRGDIFWRTHCKNKEGGDAYFS